jgi:RHS repeat-associated protein
MQPAPRDTHRPSWLLLAALLLGLVPAATHLALPTRVLASDAYESAVLDDSPTVYYPLNEANGSTAYDDSGNSYNATYDSSVTLGITPSATASTDSATAISVSGSGIPLSRSGSMLPTGNSARTGEIWFKTTVTGYQMLLNWGTFGADDFFDFYINGSQVYVGDYNYNVNFASPATLDDGNWHMADVTWDPSGGPDPIHVYIDGDQVYEGAFPDTSTLNTGSGIFAAGAEVGGGLALSGSLDDVAVYPSALSASDIAAHYDATLSTGSQPAPTAYSIVINDDAPAAYYRMDENAGSQIAVDSSAYGVDGVYESDAVLGETSSATPLVDSGTSLTTTGTAISRSSTGLPVGNSDRTAEIWFKTTSSACGAGQVLIAWGAPASDQYFDLYLCGNTVRVGDWNYNVAFDASDGTNLEDGNWHLLDATYDSNAGDGHQVAAYVDGRYLGDGSFPDTSSLNTASGAFTIGGESDGSHAFAGSLAEAAVYSTALSAARVEAHYLSSGDTPPPVGGAETSNENGGSCTCDSSNTGDPVNTTSGNFYEQATDISIAGRSLPLEIVRTYNSQDASVAGPLGYGWSYNYGTSLAVSGTSPNEIATITMANGDQETFDQPASGESWPPSAPRFVDTLTHSSGSSTWTLVVTNHDTYTFNSSGQLTQETDLNGYTTSFSYTSGNLAAVMDPAGRILTLGWTGSNLTSVTDSNVSGNTRTVSYSYDSNGNLEDVIDVNGGDTHYEYDSSHQMTVMKDPVCEATSGCPGVENDYNSSGQVDWQKDQLNRETTFSYSGTPYTAAGGSTLVTDPAGNETDYQYQWGLLTAETVGYGTSDAATTRDQYDPATLGLIGVEDPNGNITSYTRDSSGNVLTTSDPLGRVTTHTYNSFDEVLTTEDGNGVTTTNTYNSNGDLTSTSTPLTNTTATGTNCGSPTTAVAMAAVTCYTYGDTTYPGDLTAVTDPDGNVTDYQYDAYGNRDEVKDPAGHVTATEYNADDWVLDTWTAKAGCSWGSAPPTGCSSTYETQYNYEAPGTSAINEFGLVGTITDPLGDTTETTYDGDGRTLTVEDGDGNTTTSAYDLAGELCWTLPGGTSSAGCSSPPTNAQVTTYNSDGTVHEQKDGKGDAIITYEYNHCGQVTSTEDALGNTTTYTLDADGNILTKLDPVSGATCSGTEIGCTTYMYDADNELTAVSYSDSPSEDVTSITYDSDGQQTGMTDGTGNSTWAYDSLHRLTSYTDGNGDTVDYGYTYGSGPTYDLKDQVRSITYPNAVGTVDQSWNADGTLASVTDWNGNESTFSYDANGNETGQTVPSASNVTDTFGYNAADQMTSVSDAAGSTTLFSATYTRDDNGQVTSDSSVPSTVGSYQYTVLDQLCYAGSANSTPCPSPPTGSQAYAFDSADNLTTNKGTTQQFNAADELCWTVSGTSSNACSSTPSGATTYAYDTQGNLTSEVPGSGSATCYTYDQSDRLTEVQTGTGSTCTTTTTVATYSYDGNGVRQSKTVSGTTTHFTSDGSGGTLLQQNAGSTVTSFIYGPNGPVEQTTGSTTTYLHHDQLGSIRLITDSAGSSSTATTMTYDPYGNVTSSSGSLTSPFGFAGQYTDSESGLLHMGARYYKPPTGQFLTVDPDVATTLSPYGYVADDPLNARDPLGLGPFGLCLRNPFGGNNGNGGCQTVLSTSQGATALVITAAAGVAIVSLGTAVPEEAAAGEALAGEAGLATSRAAAVMIVFALASLAYRAFAWPGQGADETPEGHGVLWVPTPTPEPTPTPTPGPMMCPAHPYTGPYDGPAT